MQRFCVINCENSAAWKPIDFAEMFQQTLTQPNDVWTRCNVAMGEELPSDLLKFQGIVITGSHFNCRDRERLPWFDKVCDIIRNASVNARPRIYGGCFGQIIAFALGGVVDRNPQEKFVLRAERIVWSYTADGKCNCCESCSCKHFQQSSFSTSHIDSLTACIPEAKSCCVAESCDSGTTCNCVSSRCCKPSNEEASSCGASCRCSSVSELPLPVEFIEAFKTRGLKLLESHGDCVCCLPPGAVLLGNSCSCCSEIYLAGSKLNILACQSHPEFDMQYAINERIWPTVVEKNNRLSEEEVVLAQETFASYDPADASLMLRAISHFLHCGD